MRAEESRHRHNEGYRRGFLGSGTRWQQVLERFRIVPDTEAEQNVVRVVFIGVWLISAFVHFFYTSDDPIITFAALGAYMAYSIGNFYWMYFSPKKSLARRVLVTIGDRLVTTIILLVNGGWTTPGYFVYLWVDIGNAARYGRSYLLPSTALSAISFGIVLLFNDYWRSLGNIAIGNWVAILIMPLFSTLFLKRLKKVNDCLAELATRDTLTRLPNRQFLYERLGEAIAEAERHKQHFAVIFVDIDDFKQINDTKGHEAGDDALRATATALKQSIRHGDLVARLGGDEFVILLHNVGGQNLHHVAENIREALGAHTKERLSASLGVATYPACGTDAETLIRHADHAMYAAKKAGKRSSTVCKDLLHH